MTTYYLKNGRVRLNMSVEPQTHKQLLELAGGPRKIGKYLDDLLNSLSVESTMASLERRIADVEEYQSKVLVDASKLRELTARVAKLESRLNDLRMI